MSGAKDVDLAGVSKSFGAVRAVRPLSLHVRAGEFLTLLGPSGCGKSTLLRLIAGLEQVSGGTIRVGGEDVTDHPPNRRDTGIMFQDYALFPHKTLLENVGYGLKMRRVARRARESRAASWLGRIGLEGYGQRLPHELSGGQRQRVALARSLIVEPGVLLLDEPLGALDANLRRQMQDELRRMHRDLGLTFIYVTHDQEEALAMSDRVAVMRDGRIEQLGSPVDIYDRPGTEFVARFIGACNVISARVRGSTESGVECEADGLATLVAPAAPGGHAEGERIVLALRPEAISIRRDGSARPPGPNETELRVRDVAFTGATLKVAGDSPGGRALDLELERAALEDRAPLRPGDRIVAAWRASDLTVLREPDADGDAEHDGR